MFAVLGILVVVIFSLITWFNFKTREKEISVLRTIGWSLKDLGKQFLSEAAVVGGVAVLAGNILAFLSLKLLSTQTITLEIPWEVSAKPHFLPKENAIDRTITAHLPLNFNPWVALGFPFGFFMLFLIINYLALWRLKQLKPHQFFK